MVYDHHNHYTLSIVYDYRPLEAFQKFLMIIPHGLGVLPWLSLPSYLYTLA